MAQSSSRHLAACGHVADELDAVWIGCFRGIELLKRSFNAIYSRNQSKVPIQTRATVRVNRSNGSTHLIVCVTLDVFHQKIDQPGITLQDVQQLQRAIDHLGLLDWRSNYRN